MEQVEALRAALEASAAALAEERWAEVAARIDVVLADEGAAKRALRALARAPVAGIDPWRIDVVIARSGRAGLVRSQTLEVADLGAGLDDPEPHVRALAITQHFLRAAARGQAFTADETDGAREVVAWITGRALEDPGAPHLRRNQLFFYDVAHRALSGRELVSRSATESRAAELARLGAGLRTPLAAIGGSSVAQAVAGLVSPTQGATDIPEPADPAALVDALWAESIRLSAPGARDDQRALARWIARLPDALTTEWAGEQLAGFAIWQMAPSLARALSQRGHDELLAALERAIAGSGLGSAAVQRRVVRTLRWVPAERVRSFVHRLAYSTCVRQRKGAAWMWSKGGLRTVVTAVRAEHPSLGLVERLFGPPPEPLPEPEALAGLAEAATRELAGGADLDAAAHWERDEARRFLDLTRDGKTPPLVALLPAAIEAGRALGAPATSTLIDLALASGRHGERYVPARAFAIRSGRLDVVAADDAFEVLVDAASRLERARAATEAIRAAARLGRSPRAEVQRCAAAIEELPSARFWSSVGAELRRSPAAVRVRAFDPGIPWELAPLAQGDQKVPLGLAAPCARERGPIAQHAVAERSEVRALLALFDASMPGAEAEATQIAERWRGAGGEAWVASELDEARAIGGERAIDVLHFAGHQGPADDSTPSLSLGGRALSLIDLESCFAGALPALVFLHACSTLAPAREGGLGALPALLSSPFPQIVGTLWDVTPPDPRLVLAFYDAVASGQPAARALQAARVAVARSAAWAGWWPSYVLWSSQ